MPLARGGVIGLTIIVLATVFNGVVEEDRLGHAFREALPFTTLLVVFSTTTGLLAVVHLL